MTAPDDEPLARLPKAAPVGTSTPIEMPVSPTTERRERELEDLLSELGSDGRIKIWHVIDGKSSYAGEMSLDGFTLDALLEAYGGGDKTLVFYQGREKKETVRYSLDPSIPPRNPRTPKPTAPSASGAPSLGDMSTLIAAMAQSSMSSMQMMQTMMAQGQQMTTTMLNAVATVLASKKDDRDPMDVALKMAELLKSSGANTPASELFTIFEKGMNVAKAMGGNDEDGTLTVVKEGLSLVGKIVEKQGASGAPPLRVPSGTTAGNGRVLTGRPSASVRPVSGETLGNANEAAPSSDAGGAGTDATTHMSAIDRPWVAAARPAAGLLLMAIGNVQPETAANMIADRLSPDEFGDLLDDIEAGTPDEFIGRFRGYFALDPFVPDVDQWMHRCVSALVDLVEGDGDLPADGGAVTSTP